MVNPQNTSITGFSHEDSNEQSSGSAALIGSNDDLLTEILLRVPATSIIRFRSVSKHWRRFLSNRHFTLRYDKLSKSPGLFVENGIFVNNAYVPFDVENPNPLCFPTLDFYPAPCGADIVQSCNRLLLYRNIGYVKHHRVYYVFNPTTKQFATIPSLPGGPDVCESIVSMSLAFHATDCVRYKVVCVREIEPGMDLFQIQMYSSDTGNWKVSVESFVSDYCTIHRGGVYWNGAIHWHPSLNSHLYFKVEDERLQTLPLRMQVASRGGSYDEEIATYFGESRGHLHLVTGYRFWNDLHFNVYELSSDLSGWFVKYQLEFDELSGAFPEMRMHVTNFYIYGIDVVRGEKEEDTLIVVKIPNRIVAYNIHDKSFKKIFTLTSDTCTLLRGHRYTEILSSF